MNILISKFQEIKNIVGASKKLAQVDYNLKKGYITNQLSIVRKYSTFKRTIHN